MAAESTEPAVEGDAMYEQTWPDPQLETIGCGASVAALGAASQLEETHQMIDRKLTEMGKGPQNVQVIVQETLYTEVILHLVDSEGVIGQSAPATHKRISMAVCDEAA